MALLLPAGCAILGPPPPTEAVLTPVAVPGPPQFIPATWALSVDRQGLSPLELTASATASDDQAAFMPDDDDAGLEYTWPTEGRVEPILISDTFDIPNADNEMVDKWVEYLTGRGRGWFERWLARSTRYVPVFSPILEAHGVPQDLVFLSMIESGFSPRAYSWAHAAGPWQFIPGTGRRYGLRIGFWLDQRRDFVRSTHAAAKYLSRLHDRFGHWYLAFAAYNAGPGRVSRAMRATRTDDFWRIARTRRLKRETKHYVPKLLAAARISKRPAAYGFEDVEYLPPLKWDAIAVELATDLKTAAAACGLSGSEPLELLNPELRCKVTPPGETYELRVPYGLGPTCAEGLAALGPTERYTFRYHDRTKRESLARLAAMYTTTATAILSFNEITEAELKSFDEIVIPIKVADAASVPLGRPNPHRFRPAKYGPLESRLIIHRVRSGDSLWRIARRYRVSIKKLRLWNGLWRTNTLRIGQRLRIHTHPGVAPGRRASGRAGGKADKAASGRHRVRAGESLWSIAVRYGTTVSKLCSLNGIGREDKLQIGRVLRVR